MCSTSVFTCIMTMISNCAIFFPLQKQQIFTFSCNSCNFLLITSIFCFLKSIIFIAYFLKDSQNFFIQPLSLYISCLFFYFLKWYRRHWTSDRKCLLTFAIDNFPGLFLHLSTFSIKDARSAWTRNGSLSEFLYWLKL